MDKVKDFRARYSGMAQVPDEPESRRDVALSRLRKAFSFFDKPADAGAANAETPERPTLRRAATEAASGSSSRPSRLAPPVGRAARPEAWPAARIPEVSKPLPRRAVEEVARSVDQIIAEEEARELARQAAAEAARAAARKPAEEKARVEAAEAVEAEVEAVVGDAVEEEARKAAEAEARRAAQTFALKAAEAIARKAAEAEARKAADAEVRRSAEAEARRLAGALAHKAAEAEARKAVEAEARKAAEAEVRKAAEEARKAAEAEARSAAEAEARIAAEARRVVEERARKAEEALTLKAAEQVARKAAEAEARKVAEGARKMEEAPARKAAAAPSSPSPTKIEDPARRMFDRGRAGGGVMAVARPRRAANVSFPLKKLMPFVVPALVFIAAAFFGGYLLKPLDTAVAFVGGLIFPPPPVTILADAEFEICQTAVRINCVIDGATLWYGGSEFRVADVDAPRVSNPQCASEAELGRRAAARLLELVNAGPFEIAASGGRGEDQYGRTLRVLMRDGQSLGGILIDEGLAEPSTGFRRYWC